MIGTATLGRMTFMRGLGFAVGSFCLLISLVAHSEDARLGSSLVKVSPPNGFCELDKTNKADMALFDVFSNYSKVGGFSPIALYLDCRELDASRTSGTFILTKLAFASFMKPVDRPPSQYISDACDKLREGLSDEQKARASKYVTEFSKGTSSLQNTMPLGVLDEVKGAVCYSGQLIKAKVANTGEVTLVYLTAGTTVGNQPVGIFQWTNYEDATSIAAALANLKSIYSNFAAANGKTE
jgi:hypothetical protein